MSHTMGEVIHDGKVVGYYEYNGTSDIALNRIFADRKELWEVHWRTPHANDARCSCGQPPVDVLLYTDYGDGFHWTSQACLVCQAILGIRNPFDPPCTCNTFGYCSCGGIVQDGHPLKENH